MESKLKIDKGVNKSVLSKNLQLLADNVTFQFECKIEQANDGSLIATYICERENISAVVDMIKEAVKKSTL